MKLPEAIVQCLNALEQAGFEAYAVGGCVRDRILGLEPQDYDLCTNALPEQIQTVFRDHRLVLAGTKHGTVGVVIPGGVVEITTFRTEGGYTDHRHPDWVRFVPQVEADLARRDFTVNAMAYSPTRGFRDPYGGREDLKNHVLRAVGEPEQRFREDALRILRGVRFASRYGLIPEDNTRDAMFRLAPLMDNLARERVFDELCKLLLTATATDLLTFAPVITAVIPELAPQVGFDQRSPHHAYDIFTHTAYVVENTPRELPLRWAALLHDSGKPQCFTTDETGRGHFYGHAQESAAIADAVLRRLKAPTELRETAVLLIGQHMTRPEPDPKILRRRMNRLGVPHFRMLLQLQQADMCSKGVCKDEEKAQFSQVLALVDRILEEDACLTLHDLAVDGRDLMALGFQGPDIGRCLNHLLEQVLDAELENQREDLLSAAVKFTP